MENKDIKIPDCLKWVNNKTTEQTYAYVCRSKLEKAIKETSINPRYQGVLTLYYLRRLPLKEVAKKMKKSYMATRILLCRARKKLANSKDPFDNLLDKVKQS